MLKKTQNHHSIKWISSTIALLLLTACGHMTPVPLEHCVAPAALYKNADLRQVDTPLFTQALNCDNPQTVEIALINLGRIGGEDAAKLIEAQLKHQSSSVRAKAAFAAGISLYPELVAALAEQFDQESNPSVKQALTLAMGNLGHDKSAAALYTIINTTKEDAAAKGAMQGLGILALFHPDKLIGKHNLNIDKVIEYLANPNTALEASFLLARVPLINSSHLAKMIEITDKLDSDSQAFAIRAIGNLKSSDHFDWLYEKALSDDVGISVSAIQALGKLPTSDKNQQGKVIQLLASDKLISRLTSLESASNWLPLRELMQLTTDSNSWIQAAAFNAINNKQPQALQKIAAQWLETDEPNLQRAAISFYIKQNDKNTLEKLANSAKSIIATGAQQKLGTYQAPETAASATPEKVLALPQSLTLKTTQGDIVIRLFEDTPYTAANFIKLAQQGFYDKSYFHRVIPNFVAQGGGRFGDGSGSVGYSIREELSQRSHRFGTIGMATSGKDTGGGQFFINLAPNLHLDSNYTIFGEVIAGMEVALKLEQNDQVLVVEIN